MRTLWRRMAEIYGQRWTSAYGEDAAKGAGDTWAKGLIGVAPEQLARGLEACIVAADPWPPTLPAFRAMCMGVPSLHQVREDLARVDTEREPFTLMVARRMDGWAWRHATTREAEAMLREAYADAREAVMRGEPLPERLQAIEAKPEPAKPATQEVARRHMDEIRKTLEGHPLLQGMAELYRTEAAE